MLASFDWVTFKNELARLTVAKDALHIYAAFLIQVCAAMLLRKSLGSVIPWLAVLLVELLNEVGDVLLNPTEEHLQEWQIVGSLHDLVNTMLLPTMLLLIVRYAPGLWRSDHDPLGG